MFVNSEVISQPYKLMIFKKKFIIIVAKNEMTKREKK